MCYHILNQNLQKKPICTGFVQKIHHFNQYVSDVQVVLPLRIVSGVLR